MAGEAMEYLDFDVEIGLGSGREYPLAVVHSPAGEAPGATLHFPFDEIALELRLKDLQIALLRSGGKRRQVLLPEEQKSGILVMRCFARSSAARCVAATT